MRADKRYSGSNICSQQKAIHDGSANTNENANLNEEAFGGQINKTVEVTSGEYSRVMLLEPDVLKAFDEGRIHIHDFASSYSFGMHNCTTIDLEPLLKNGYVTKNGGVRGANSIGTALHLVYAIFGMQSNQQFGGVSSGKFDYDLAPYLAISYKKHFNNQLYSQGFVESMEEAKELAETLPIIRIDDKWNDIYDNVHDKAKYFTLKELHGGLEALFHNLVTSESRSGNQLPFTSINYSGTTSVEAKYIAEYILKVRQEGIGPNKEIPIFPIGIFQYEEKYHGPGGTHEDLFKKAVECTTKCIYPNYVKVEDQFVDGDPDCKNSTMGCRTMNAFDRHGRGHARSRRGNGAPVTINLPYLALLSEGNIGKFKTLLQEHLLLAERSLLARYKRQKTRIAGNAPYQYRNRILETDNVLDKQDSVEEAIKHLSYVFGYIGLAEALTCLVGKHHGASDEAYALGLEIIGIIKKYADAASDRNDLNMGCYATPAESLCMKALKKTKDRFGVVEGVTDKNYFTNSHHIPVDFEVTLFAKINLEQPFTELATSGTITYVELPADARHNLSAVEDIIRYAMHINIPYFAVNVPLDSCYECGHKGYDLKECPKCKSKKIKKLRRVTGYLTTDVAHMNDGKKSEVSDRVKHGVNHIEEL
jgi:ribonucleoside-triphosphate reductase